MLWHTPTLRKPSCRIFLPRSWRTLLFAVVGTLSLPAASRSDAVDLPRLIARGDIRRDHAPRAGETWLPLYQANGRLGSCYGPWGLQATPKSARSYELEGGSYFTHLKHWVRAKYNADYLLPVASIYWEQEPQAVKEYEQHQVFYDGILKTRFRADNYSVDVESWFDPVHRDVAGFRINVEGNCPAIIFAPFAPAGGFPFKYDQHLTQTFTGGLTAGTWRGSLQCLDRQTPLSVWSSSGMEIVPEGVRLTLKPGRNDILVTIGTDSVASADASYDATVSAWHALWNRSGWLELPDADAQKVWVRSLAYIFDSHNDDGLGESPPNGLSGVGWQFPFPFDSGCRQPLLLWTGHSDVAKTWIEFWHERIDGLREYTRRIWQTDGVMLPHVFPYGSAGDYHLPEPPNRFYYPVYNAGHMVRMAHQTAVMAGDPVWAQAVARPLIEGAAQFYLGIAKKGADDLWHFSITPSIGLDEAGGNDQPDYFCTLVSAEYTFRRAIEYGLDRDGRMATILREGLAYRSLLSPRGTYYGNAGTGARELGRQKHPDQLFAVVHLPLGHAPDAPTVLSYRQRYDLIDPKKPSFQGHTGGEFILASARMHDPEGWRKDWSIARSSLYADPDWIQFYETSGRELPFYVTTHGLFAQAILETTVSTWWGQLDLGACIPWSGVVRFGNIRTSLGVTVSGYVADGRGEATLKAWKDTSFLYQARRFSLKRGEEVSVTIGVPARN